MKVKLYGDVQCPKQGREGDAGYDFFLAEDVIINPGELVVIDTQVAVEIPAGFAGLLALRSSVCKNKIYLFNPLIDSNYRGVLHALCYSMNDKPLEFRKGERLYSLYVFPVYQGALEVVDELSSSNRNANWNGSSGK